MHEPGKCRTETQDPEIRIVVNADDFGFFDAVSAGIIEGAQAGVITATGVMANGPALDRWIDALKALPGLSVGVHLNATLGAPLTCEMSEQLAKVGGRFPSKGRLVSLLMRGHLSVRAILAEWRAQITHCLDRGLRIEFVNSHEHLHVLPGLYQGVRQLADAIGVRHVRAPLPEWGPSFTPAGALRNAVFAGARLLTPDPPVLEPALIGVAQSGRLNLDYCRWRFPRLARSRQYELMCHPGRIDPVASTLAHLRAYHDWEGELEMLLSRSFSDLLKEHHLRPVNFAQLNRDEAHPLSHIAQR